MQRIPGYSNYSVTKDGRIWTHNLRAGWMLPTTDRNGYARCMLIGDNGKSKGMYVHQLVALTYIQNPHNKKFVNHLDHNKSNNSISNLQWCTQKENIIHDWKNNKRPKYFGSDNRNSKLTVKIVRQIRELHSNGITQMSLSKKFGISQPTISQIVLQKTWREV